MNRWSLVALCAIACVLAPSTAAQKKAKGKSTTLEVGTIALPIGEIGWVKLGGVDVQKSETDIAALRGRVVVVADYGYYCDSCVRVGVPLMKALRASNEPSEFVVIPLTAGIGDDTDAVIKKEAEKLGIESSVGVTDVEGQGSPYLDMNANGNLTYAFVIGRSGGVVWRGDPSRKRDEYIAAVSSALNAVPCAPLPEDPASFGAELAPALREYVLGDFQKAEASAQALLKKLGAKTGAKTSADAERVRSEANALVALVDATRKPLMERLEKTGGAKDSENFQEALSHVRRAFPKGLEADRANSLEMYVTIQSTEGPACRKWAEWYELEAARPATFPAEKDTAGTKYARQLASYVKLTDVPGLERAKQWLATFDKSVARK